MLAYSLRLAVHSFGRNKALTALVVAAVAIGIAGTMSTYTMYYAMAADPIPWKSSRLFAPQIDNWGPEGRDADGEPPDQVTYRDAVALLRAHKAIHQAVMYPTRLTFAPTDANQAPFLVTTRATSSEFFPMFDVPFASGQPWGAAEDESRANVVVLGARLAERLFPDGNAVGRTVAFDGRDYRVVGVLKEWNPAPRFYEVSGNGMADPEDVFLPFNTAIDRRMEGYGRMSCHEDPDPGSGWQGILGSECVWLQFWVELADAAEARRYREYLERYALDQQRTGRFDWPPAVRLRNVREWLQYQHVVTDEVRAMVIVSFGFFAVCLVNAIGLMLAKFTGRAGELAVRRALGASQRALFLQCLGETALIGLAGGALGFVLTLGGVAVERSLMPSTLARVTQVDLHIAVVTLALAVAGTLCAGVLPAMRASRLPPAGLLKAQ